MFLQDNRHTQNITIYGKRLWCSVLIRLWPRGVHIQQRSKLKAQKTAIELIEHISD